jgi:hypothetical protein
MLLVEPGAFYIMDRGYIDFTRPKAMAQYQAFFVVRARDNVQFRAPAASATRATGCSHLQR